MLVEKEIIAPGEYWYSDINTGAPHKLKVTPELTKYWHEQGSAMLSSGLTVPVPYEHDFTAHPMTPKDKLLNNAGWVKEYKLKDYVDPITKKVVKDALFGMVSVEDEEIAKKLPTTIRWTSPWINSFDDGNGKRWNNVISHLALTTRPRITKQQPFPSIAAAMSLMKPVESNYVPTGGYCLSRAGRLLTRKKDGAVKPKYPIAFSLLNGAPFGDDDFPPKKDKKPDDKGGKGGPPDPDGDGDADAFEDIGAEDPPPAGGGETPPAPQGGMPPGVTPDADPTNNGTIDAPPFGSPQGDITMEELLCDLLGALGIFVEKSGNEAMFKRALYTASMQKVNELTQKGQSADKPQPGELTQPGAKSPNNPSPSSGANPLIQQEQQPMYMSLEEIQKLPEPMKGFALSLHADYSKRCAEMDASNKLVNSLRDARLKEAATARNGRVAMLCRVAPNTKAELEAMLASPAMALSLGDGGTVNDPMDQTLKVLERGLSSIPKMLLNDSAAFNVQPQPTDGDMNAEEENALADRMARMMGCPPEPRKAG